MHKLKSEAHQRLSHHFLPGGPRNPNPDPEGNQSNNPLLFFFFFLLSIPLIQPPAPHTAPDTFQGLAWEHMGGEGHGGGGGDSPYSLEEGVIHKSMWGRKWLMFRTHTHTHSHTHESLVFKWKKKEKKKKSLKYPHVCEWEENPRVWSGVYAYRQQ